MGRSAAAGVASSRRRVNEVCHRSFEPIAGGDDAGSAACNRAGIGLVMKQQLIRGHRAFALSGTAEPGRGGNADWVPLTIWHAIGSRHISRQRHLERAGACCGGERGIRPRGVALQCAPTRRRHEPGCGRALLDRDCACTPPSRGRCADNSGTEGSLIHARLPKSPFSRRESRRGLGTGIFITYCLSRGYIVYREPC